MTDELDHQVRLALQRRRRSPILAMAIIVVALLATACAYLWFNYGDQVRTALSATAPAKGLPAATDGEAVGRAEFEAFARQATNSSQTVIENLEGQKADLKKLSDRVNDLATTLQALQRAQSEPPAQTAVSSRATTAAPNRKPKPTGHISVGGAPLPPTPQSDR